MAEDRDEAPQVVRPQVVCPQPGSSRASRRCTRSQDRRDTADRDELRGPVIGRSIRRAQPQSPSMAREIPIRVHANGLVITRVLGLQNQAYRTALSGCRG